MRHSEAKRSLLGFKMTGDGATIGAYAAWHYNEHWSMDGMLGWTDSIYNGSMSGDSASFRGSSWLGSGGFTGTYRWNLFVLQPSVRIITAWERDGAWNDSFGNTQTAMSFSAGRVSTGDEISYPLQASPNLNVAPYVGLYGDYYFATHPATVLSGVPFIGIADGWSGRLTAGAMFTNGRVGPSLSLGGELGGLGAGYKTWTLSAQAMLPF